jgi:hypothetical protein
MSDEEAKELIRKFVPAQKNPYADKIVREFIKRINRG